MGNKNHLKNINDQNLAHFMRVSTKAFTVSLECVVQNWSYWANSASSTKSNLNKGIYVILSRVCVSYVLNWSSWTSNNTWNVRDAEFALSSDGISWLKSCSINEYLSEFSLSPYIYD